jgi:hypothetical protein
VGLEVAEEEVEIDPASLPLDSVEQQAAGQRKEILVLLVYVLSAQATPCPDANAEFPAAIAEVSEP